MTRATFFLSAFLALGCGSSDPEKPPSCAIGTEDCACTEGGACDPNLVCSAGTCRGEPDPPDPPDPDVREYFSEADYGDWPDCYARCGNAYDLTPFDVVLTGAVGEETFSVNGVRYASLRGQIDGDAHAAGFGYDIDFVRVRAPARRLIEVLARPLSGSATDPYLSTFDPELEAEAPLYGWMTQNDSAGGEVWARTLLASPYGDALPWFVAVDEAANVLGDAEPVGGADFGYELRFRSLGGVEFTELELDDTGSASATARELLESGDLHYYRFVDPGHGSYLVDFETTNPDFCGHLWQIDLVEGAVWLPNGATDDTPDDGCEQALSFQTFPAFYQEGTDAYVFAVTDYMGRGSDSGLGAFEYEVRVELAPRP